MPCFHPRYSCLICLWYSLGIRFLKNIPQVIFMCMKIEEHSSMCAVLCPFFHGLIFSCFCVCLFCFCSSLHSLSLFTKRGMLLPFSTACFPWLWGKEGYFLNNFWTFPALVSISGMGDPYSVWLWPLLCGLSATSTHTFLFRKQTFLLTAAWHKAEERAYLPRHPD